MNNLGASSCNIRSNSHLIIPKTGQFKFLSMARVDVAKSGFSRLLQFIWKHKIESGTNLKLKTMCCVIETGPGTKHETFLSNQEKRPSVHRCMVADSYVTFGGIFRGHLFSHEHCPVGWIVRAKGNTRKEDFQKNFLFFCPIKKVISELYIESISLSKARY